MYIKEKEKRFRQACKHNWHGISV